jgi:hypothetical protein
MVPGGKGGDEVLLLIAMAEYEWVMAELSLDEESTLL